MFLLWLFILIRKQQLCFAVKHQICFVDYETSPNLPSACGRVDHG